MANAVIYYKMDSNESIEEAVHQVNKSLEKIEARHKIIGVFMDEQDSSAELMDLMNSTQKDIDYLYINKEIDDEFDNTLLSELSKRGYFQVRLID